MFVAATFLHADYIIMNVIFLIMNIKGLYENIIIDLELNTKWVINREIKIIVVYKII